MEQKEQHDINISEAQKLHNQALKHIQTGNITDGIRILQKAAELMPNNVSIINNLGKALLLNNNPHDAAIHLEKVIAQHPSHIEAYSNLGQAYYRIGQYGLTEETYNKALDLEPDCVPILVLFGTFLSQMNRAPEAIEKLRKASELKPELSATWYKLIALLEFTGDLGEAEKKIAIARQQPDPDEPALDLLEGRILRRRKKYDEAANVLEKVVRAEELNPAYYSAYYQLGKTYDSLNRENEAFEKFEIANKLIAQLSQAQQYDRNLLPNRIKQCQSIFTKDFAQSWPNAPVHEEKSPIFLVGFPRSGTTLLDQILSSHPKVAVSEEKPVIQHIRQKIGDNYPQNIATLSSNEILELRDMFFDIHKHQNKDQILIDKMPLNIHDTGLIYRLFPNSQFILAQRHPCDCVLSCFMQEFILNASMVHFLKLKDSASFYDMTFNLWEQYCSVLPLKIHTVRYEDVVSDLEATIATLLEAIGLPWDDAVLHYDQTARSKATINTPSYDQVTQKIYNTARYRWVHYRTQMEPVLETLKPWITKYGYDA